MSSNKKMHDKLAKIYGNKCMFLASHCDTVHFKQYQARYTSKRLQKLIKNITVHHLKHRSEGGHTDIKNCSLVSELAHRYIHTLPREKEEIINNKIKDYKKCKIEFTDDVPEIELHYAMVKPSDISRSIEKQRKKDKKEFNKERLKWEDR